MTVGTLRLALLLHDCQSLKDKRSVIKKILQKTRTKFNVSAAEIDDNDAVSRATLAFVTVSNDSRFANSVMDKVLNFVDTLYLAEIYDHQIEMVHL